MATKKKSGFKDIIQSEQPVLLDFHATWCGPCKAFAPVLDQLKQEMGDAVRVIKIDIDKNQQLAQSLQVQSVPTLMIYQRGEMKWRAMGGQSLSGLRKQLQPLLK